MSHVHSCDLMNVGVSSLEDGRVPGAVLDASAWTSMGMSSQSQAKVWGECVRDSQLYLAGLVKQ